jgi:hypothetical protein
MSAQLETAPEKLSVSQKQFASALFDCNADVPDALVGGSQERVRRGFNVHRNNVYSTLPECVLAKYPVVQRIVGREFAIAAARVFVARHPPPCPVLLWYGRQFPDFLAAFEPAQTISYLSDVARLEWAIAEAQCAADATAISGDVLATIPLEVIGQATIALHPSLRFVASEHPIYSIWIANTREETAQRLEIKANREVALVVRPRFEVFVLQVDRGFEAFVSALSRNETIDDAILKGSYASPEFAFSDALITLFSSGCISGIAPPNRAACPSTYCM